MIVITSMKGQRIDKVVPQLQNSYRQQYGDNLTLTLGKLSPKYIVLVPMYNEHQIFSTPALKVFGVILGVPNSEIDRRCKG